MIIFSPRLENYQFSQPRLMFLIYGNTIHVRILYLSMNDIFVKIFFFFFSFILQEDQIGDTESLNLLEESTGVQDWTIPATFSAIFCFFPSGIVAIYSALKVFLLFFLFGLKDKLFTSFQILPVPNEIELSEPYSFLYPLLGSFFLL